MQLLIFYASHLKPANLYFRFSVEPKFAINEQVPLKSC